MGQQQPETENIELRLPVSEEYVTSLRLFISGLAGRLGYSVDEIEDLKLAVTETFLTVMQKTDPSVGFIKIRWELAPENLRVSVSDPLGKVKSVTEAPVFSAVEEISDDLDISEDETGQRIDIGFDRPELGQS